MIRENKEIIGITIEATEQKILQFADDTQMMTQGDAVSFDQIVQTIDIFGRKSGLLMNSSKTQAVWLGNRKGSDVRYAPNLKIEWNPLKFKILGVWLTPDLNDCETINYDEKFSEIKVLFRIWMKRQITPLGRIAVLKSLILSKLVHLWMLLPNPPDKYMQDFQKMIFKFIWNKKPDKIKRLTAIKSVRDGGIGAVDIEAFADSLKLSWIRKLVTGNHGWTHIIQAQFPTVKFLNKCGSKLPIGKTYLNRFWLHTFQAYNKFYKKIKLDNPEEVVAEPIFFNENINVNDKLLKVVEWIEYGVYKICHFLNLDGSFMSLDEFVRKYHFRVNFLTYAGVICAIRKFLQRTHVTIPDNSAKENSKAFSIVIQQIKGSKHFYDRLVENTLKPKFCDKWSRKLDRDINWSTTFYKIQKIKEVKLKWFQIRIINRIIATNRSLKWMKITNCDKCSFCKDEIETIEHLFWGCDKVHSFWIQLMNVLLAKCDHLNSLNFCEELILLGHMRQFKSDEILDLIILLGKFYVYMCRFGNNVPNHKVFIKQLYTRYEMDKYLSYTNEQFRNMVDLWQPYIQIFDIT